MWKYYDELLNKSKNDNVEIISIDNIQFKKITNRDKLNLYSSICNYKCNKCDLINNKTLRNCLRSKMLCNNKCNKEISEKKLNYVQLLKEKAIIDNAKLLKVNNVDVNLFNETDRSISKDMKCEYQCGECNQIDKKVIIYCVKKGKGGLFCDKCIEKKRYIKIAKSANETKNKKNQNDPNRQKMINQKAKETNDKKNKENPNRIKEIYNKINNTKEKKNKENPKKHKEIIEKAKIKRKETNDKKNAENPNRPQEIYSKIKKKSFSTKDYTLPSGEIIQVQGYENLALDELFENNYKEDEIITQCDEIEYEFNNKIHYYYADIYLINENKIIEVKSTWTFDKDYDKNIAKKNACLEQGFDFEFWIYDNKKNKKII